MSIINNKRKAAKIYDEEEDEFSETSDLEIDERVVNELGSEREDNNVEESLVPLKKKKKQQQSSSSQSQSGFTTNKNKLSAQAAFCRSEQQILAYQKKNSHITRLEKG